MDEWVRTIVGGLVGASLPTAVAYLKLRHDETSRQDAAYESFFRAIEAVIRVFEVTEPARISGSDLGDDRPGAALGDLAVGRTRLYLLGVGDELRAEIDSIHAEAAALYTTEVALDGPSPPAIEQHLRRQKIKVRLVAARDRLLEQLLRRRRAES